MEETGVTIGLREIYDTIQEVAVGVRRLDERSRQALQIAQETSEEVESIKRQLPGIIKL